jgi:hypothetical protein
MTLSSPPISPDPAPTRKRPYPKYDAYQAAYYQANKAKLLEKRRARRAAQTEEQRERERAWWRKSSRRRLQAQPPPRA